VQVTKKHIVIVGATSGIAEQCARIWIKESALMLTLVGRDRNKTQTLANDLAVRNPSATIKVVTTDFLSPKEIAQSVETIFTEAPVSIALIAHGSLPDQQQCQQDLKFNQHTLEVNGISPVLFAEAFATQMEKAQQGSLALIGSVAGDRGRASNYVYGSAKAMITAFTSGLRQRLHKSNVAVVTIKPGFIDTPMTAEFKKGLLWAKPEAVAATIVKAIDAEKSEVYVPAFWWAVIAVIKAIPNDIFKRISL
jgi:short-subunit dehydrogenase